MTTDHQPDSPPEFFSVQVRGARRFYLDLTLPADGPLAVVCGGYERRIPDYEIHRETFPYYSIEFVARGKGQLTLGGRQTSYPFLMRLEVNLAAERLQNPDKLVKQVAAEMGFEDPFHFSRAFKSVFGLSPKAFRQLR